MYIYIYIYIYAYIYTVEPPYSGLIGIRLKLSWLQTCPLFLGKGYLREDMLNGVDANLLS